MQNLFVGIDVSKDSFSATGIDVKGNACFSLSDNMDSNGNFELFRAISSASTDLPSVSVAMESTSCYHINLFSFLSSKGLNVFLINPLLISNFAKLSLRKTKTDKKDSLTIARFLLIHKDSISKLSVSQNIQDLRDIARERESISNLIASTKNEIKRILQSIFPELESICNVFTHTMLNFLTEFPSARIIKLTDPEIITKAIENYKRGDRHLRRVIYLMTVNVIGVNNFFKAYFLRRKKEGLPYRKAVTATAHKLVRVIYAMLTHKTFFHHTENS